MPRTTSLFAAAFKSQPAVDVRSSLERTPVGVPLGLDPGGSHPWESAYHGLHGHRRATATRPATTERGGRAPKQGRGYLDPDAGRTFPTLWGTPWHVVSRHLCKPMYNKSLTAVVALTQPDREQRGGLLGHGGLLALTSYPTRTSPVLRGKWLLDTILGAPPPSPPADVPALPERGEGGRTTSVRERLERHRQAPAGATCHASIDPPGFAVEQFDGLGAWRTSDEFGNPIDATATMPDGRTVAGMVGPAGAPAGASGAVRRHGDREAPVLRPRAGPGTW